MEKKIINVEIQSNVDSASKQFDKLTKSIKETDKSATNLDATFEEVYGDLQPLTTRMGEAEDRLYELALAGKQTSQEYKDLLQSVAGYRRVQIQTDMVVDAASVTLGQKLGGSLNAVSSGFELVQGSMGLFGEESKDVEQAILKVQSAMAISSGIQGIQESVKSVQALGTAIKATSAFQKVSTGLQWLWNAAMNANPIGAIVVGITALLAVGYKLTKYFQDSSEANEAAAKSTIKNTNALKQQSVEASKSSTKLKTYNDQQYALAQAAGASSEELRKLALKHKEEEIALNKKNAILAQSTFLRERDTLAALKNSDASDEVIANQEKLVQDTYKAFKKQNEILSTSYKERAALRNSNAVAEVAERKAASDKAIEDGKSAAEKKKEENKKKIQERKDYISKNQDVEDEFQNSLLALKDKAFNGEFKKGLEQQAKKSEQDAKDAQTKLNADQFVLEVKEENTAKEIALEKEKVQARLNALDTITQIAGAESAVGKAALVAKQLLMAKELVMEVSKTITFSAQAAARSAVAVAEGTAQTAKIGFPQNIPMLIGYAAQAVGIFSAIRSAVKSAKGSANIGGVPNIPSVGNSDVVTQAVSAAPTFNVVGTSGQNQIAQTLGNQAPVKAYVVSGDVSTAQALDRNIVKTASI